MGSLSSLRQGASEARSAGSGCTEDHCTTTCVSCSPWLAAAQTVPAQDPRKARADHSCKWRVSPIKMQIAPESGAIIPYLELLHDRLAVEEDR